MFLGVWEVIAEKITEAKHRCKQRLDAADKEIANLSSKVREINNNLEEKEEELSRKKSECKELKKINQPLQDELLKTLSENESLKRELYCTKNILKDTKEELAKACNQHPPNLSSNASLAPTPEQEGSDSTSLEAILNDLDKAAEKENVLNRLRFSESLAEDYAKVIETNAKKKNNHSNFELHGVYVPYSPVPLESNNPNKKEKTNSLFIPVANEAPFFIKIRSLKKNDTYDEYHTSFSSCSCEAWKFAQKNPKTGNKIPCKHMTFLAQHLGMFDAESKN